MSSPMIDSFGAYALAFEKSYAADDWKPGRPAHAGRRLGGGRSPAPLWRGRAGARSRAAGDPGKLQQLRPPLRSPRAANRRRSDAHPGRRSFRFVVTYRRTGLPPFELRGEEWDFFRDGKLEFHREKLANVADGLEFLKRHAKELLPMRERAAGLAAPRQALERDVAVGARLARQAEHALGDRRSSGSRRCRRRCGATAPSGTVLPLPARAAAPPGPSRRRPSSAPCVRMRAERELHHRGLGVRDLAAAELRDHARVEQLERLARRRRAAPSSSRSTRSRRSRVARARARPGRRSRDSARCRRSPCARSAASSSPTPQPSPAGPSRCASGMRTLVEEHLVEVRAARHLAQRPDLDARRASCRAGSR